MATSLQVLISIIVGLCIAGSIAQSVVTINYSSSLQDITYIITYGAARPFYRAYIDTQNNQPGFAMNGIKANFLLENGVLYSYSGSGTSWAWTYASNVAFTANGFDHQWTFARSLVGAANTCLAGFKIIGQVGDTPSILTTPVIPQPLAQGQCGGAAPASAPGPGPAPAPAAPAGARGIAIPTYFNPVSYANQWNLVKSMNNSVGITVINPNSGPGWAYDGSYASTTANIQSSGQKVLGYVTTSNGHRDAATCRQEIDTYYSWYKVDGIFFDEAWVGDCNLYNYYSSLYQYVKSKGGKATVVINPGTTIPECYMTATDIVMNGETDYQNYQNWRGAGWESKYPANRFWHVVHTAPAWALSNIASLTRRNNAGWVYITTEIMPNPYMLLPSSAYLSNEASLVQSS